MPSAAQPSLASGPSPKRKRPKFQWMGMLFGACVALFLLIGFVVVGVGLPSIGTERLRLQAERAASRFAGEPVTASLGALGLSFDSARLLSLQVSAVEMAAQNPAGPQVSAGEVRFGLQLLPLLRGQVRLGSASLVDARIVAGALRQDGQVDWAAGLKNEQGLVEPDKVLEALFQSLHRAFNGLDAGATRELDLENVEIVLPGQGKTGTFLIQSANLNRTNDRLEIAATLNLNGRMVSLKGSASRALPDAPIRDLVIALDSQPVQRDAPLIDDGAATVDPSLGILAVDIAGAEGVDATPSRLNARASMTQAAIDLGRNGIIAGTAEVQIELLEGTNRLQLKRALLQTGDTDLAFHGHLAPQGGLPGVQSGGAYRFEILSDKSQLSAEGLAEPPLQIASRLVGNYNPAMSQLSVEELRVASGEGEFLGRAEVRFDGRRAPGLHATMMTTAMPVASAKQLWPFIVSPNARRWVLQHVHGGELAESTINLAIAPGRMGDGIPFRGDEANGRFVISGARFDVHGEIPPVQDGDGVVTFAGNDVDITLSKGLSLMGDGKPVSISNGAMRIPGNQPGGTVGDLTLDLSGDAVAMGQLASYEPMNALRFLGVEAGDLKGDVWGTVRASIPLSDRVSKDRVRWAVDLAFDKLALAKPIAGQMIADASGTATIDQAKAVVAGKASLNGMPADLDLVEPIGDQQTARKRVIQLNLDDEARKKHFPALDVLVSGPMKLNVDATQAGKQQVTADLANTEIRLPWVGWNKGVGIPAKLKFDLAQDEKTSVLSDFSLSGESFSLGGALRLDKNGLASADMDRVRLTRDDDASLDLKRQGKGYAIRVRGSRFDARALIKQYLAGTAATAGKQEDETPISLDASLDNAGGFFGETLSNLKATYESSGNVLRISGVLGSGGGVAVQTDSSGGTSNVRVQSTDAGSALRLVDLYEYMRGGRIELALSGRTGRALVGSVDARDFQIVGEPKLGSIVSSAPAEGRSLNQALDREIDTSSVAFERGFTRIEKAPGSLRLSDGVVRGPSIGASFQGTVYDPNGNMDMTGTFLPAYGVNRIFGEIPLIGQILGNGRDRALIGITFRLVGDAKKPDLQINPISAIAPGIFRSIFEF